MTPITASAPAYLAVLTYAIAGTEGVGGRGGIGVELEATDITKAPPRIDVSSNDAIGLRHTMLAIR